MSILCQCHCFADKDVGPLQLIIKIEDVLQVVHSNIATS